MNKAVHVGLSVIAVVLMITVIVRPQIVDSTVLLENRHPGYWEYLRPEKANVRFIERKYKDKTNNLLFISRSEGTYNYGNVKLTINKDSSIDVKGDNDTGKDIWFEFSTGNYLMDGYYYYTDSNTFNDKVYSYVVGRKYVNDEIIKSDSFDISDGFSINIDEYNYYIFGIRIVDGAKNVHETFYPMVSTEKNCEYGAAWVKGTYLDFIEDVYSVAHFVITEEEYEHIDEQDFSILLNGLEVNYSSYNEVWIEIIDKIGNILHERLIKE